MKLVRGIGVTGFTHPTKGGGKMLREYTTWQNMLYRCTKPYWDKYPSYTTLAQLVLKTLEVTLTSISGVRVRSVLIIRTRTAEVGNLIKIF